MSFGASLTQMMKFRQLTAEKLSVKTGITARKIKNYEKGESFPDTKSLEKIIGTLDCEIVLIVKA